MSRAALPSYSCDVCNRSVSRLFGLVAVVKLSEQESVHVSVRGFCAAHRDELLPRFLADVAEQGEVDWYREEPVPLRPHEVDGFFRDMDELGRDFTRRTGRAGVEAGGTVTLRVPVAGLEAEPG